MLGLVGWEKESQTESKFKSGRKNVIYTKKPTIIKIGSDYTFIQTFNTEIVIHGKIIIHGNLLPKKVQHWSLSVNDKLLNMFLT